jgi:hypothetical protein
MGRRRRRRRRREGEGEGEEKEKEKENERAESGEGKLGTVRHAGDGQRGQRKDRSSILSVSLLHQLVR